MYVAVPGDGFTETGNFLGTPVVLAVNIKRDLPNQGRHTF